MMDTLTLPGIFIDILLNKSYLCEVKEVYATRIKVFY